MESKCFTRCFRKPGNQIEKSEEVRILDKNNLLKNKNKNLIIISLV